MLIYVDITVNVIAQCFVRDYSWSIAHLVGEELEQGGLVVRHVSDVLLGPHQVLHHQAEEEEESE